MTRSSGLIQPSPLGLVTPMTWKLMPLILMVSPSGSLAPKRFVAAVGPITATRAMRSTSPSVKVRPRSTWMSRIRG